MKKKHIACNTQMLFVAALLCVLLGLCVGCAIEKELGLCIGFGIVALVAGFVLAISPLYYVFSSEWVEIVYHFGQRERILWREIYGICLQGSWIGAGQGLPRYEIAYPRQGKRPFFLAGEIAKTAKTTKYIKKYYPKDIV